MIYRYLAFLRYLLNHPLNRNSKLKTIIKILWWLLNRSYFKTAVIVQLIPGIKCVCYPNNSHYGTLVLYSTLPEFGEMKLLLKLLRKDDVFIDVGANIGVYSLLASSKITKGRIYAFEPSLSSLPRLYENIAINNKSSTIQVEEKAVSERSGFQYLDVGNMPDYHHLTYQRGGKKNRERSTNIRVPVVTLDKFIAENSLSKIRLIKIDVEGAELLALKGLQESLKSKKVDVLIVEINQYAAAENFGSSPLQVLNYLKNYGFLLYYFDHESQLKKLNANLGGAWNVVAVHKSKKDLL